MLHSHSRHFRWRFSTTLRAHRPRSTHRPLSIRCVVICQVLRSPYLFKAQNNASKYWSVWMAPRNNWFRLFFGIQRCHDIHIVWTNCSAIFQSSFIKAFDNNWTSDLLASTPNRSQPNFWGTALSFFAWQSLIAPPILCRTENNFPRQKGLWGTVGSSRIATQLGLTRMESSPEPKWSFSIAKFVLLSQAENDCRSRTTIAHGCYDAFHTQLLRAFYTQKCLFRLARTAFICTFAASNDGQFGSWNTFTNSSLCFRDRVWNVCRHCINEA